MWLFTKYGFFSIVCARQGDGGYRQPVDRERLMVRARVRSHLIAIQKRFAELIGNCEIKTFPNSDYAFRIFVEKSTWSQVLTGLNEELNYDNFKSEVVRYQGKEGGDYEDSLHDVWSIMNRLQK